MQKRKSFIWLTVVLLLFSMSINVFATATSKYSNVTGGSNEVYFTKEDGKVFVTKSNSTDLMQIKEVTNAKIAADDCYFGLWVLDKSSNVFYYLDDPKKIGTYPTKKKIDKLGKVKSISVGSESLYALKSDGSVWSVNHNLEVSKVNGLSGITSIAIKDFDVIALKKDGTVWQWRDDPVITDYCKKRSLTKIASLTNVKQISAGADCGLALKKDDTVWQWSFSEEGASKPVIITGFTGTKAIESGRMEAYVIDGKGCVWTWKQYGETKNKPTKIKNFTGIVSFAASGKDSYNGLSFGRLVAFDKNDKFKVFNVAY